MSINNVSNNTLALQANGAARANASVNTALSSGLDAASSITQLMSLLLMNMLRSAQQVPQAGITPGLGGPGGAQGGNGMLGLLQSLVQLMQAIAPLMQALGNGNMGGANRPAGQLAGQFPGGGLGVGPQLPAGGGVATGIPVGMPVGGGLGVGPQVSASGSAAGSIGIGVPVGTPVLTAGVPLAGGGLGVGPAVSASGSANGSAVLSTPLGNLSIAGGVSGGVNAGVPGIGIPVGAGGVATGIPIAASPTLMLTPQGGVTPQAALTWAQTYGGPNLQTQDLMQGMNLYSLFTSGRKMF